MLFIRLVVLAVVGSFGCRATPSGEQAPTAVTGIPAAFEVLPVALPSRQRDWTIPIRFVYQPRRRVNMPPFDAEVDRDFYIMQYELTNAQHAYLLGYTDYETFAAMRLREIAVRYPKGSNGYIIAEQLLSRPNAPSIGLNAQDVAELTLHFGWNIGRQVTVPTISEWLLALQESMESGGHIGDVVQASNHDVVWIGNMADTPPGTLLSRLVSDSLPPAQSDPNGIHHLIGNVRELVSVDRPIREQIVEDLAKDWNDDNLAGFPPPLVSRQLGIRPEVALGTQTLVAFGGSLVTGLRVDEPTSDILVANAPVSPAILTNYLTSIQGVVDCQLAYDVGDTPVDTLLTGVRFVIYAPSDQHGTNGKQ